MVLLGGCRGRAVAGIAGVLKRPSKRAEVVTTIMLNYVAQWLVRYLIIGGPLQLAEGRQVPAVGAHLAAFAGGQLLIIFGLRGVPRSRGAFHRAGSGGSLCLSL